jgi:hypothetical protein
VRGRGGRGRRAWPPRVAAARDQVWASVGQCGSSSVGRAAAPHCSWGRRGMRGRRGVRSRRGVRGRGVRGRGVRGRGGRPGVPAVGVPAVGVPAAGVGQCGSSRAEADVQTCSSAHRWSARLMLVLRAVNERGMWLSGCV